MSIDREREELIENFFKEMVCTFRLLRPERHRIGHLRHHFGAHEFSRGHMDLFFRLMKEKEGVSVKEIADSAHITSGAVSQLIDRAVRMGFVTREEDPNDRRAQRIKLSPKAASRAGQFKENLFERLSPRFANLSNEEISQLTSLLGKISHFEEKGANCG
jgi:DNA-binding MarR family transcriptional regulator